MLVYAFEYDEVKYQVHEVCGKYFIMSYDKDDNDDEWYYVEPSISSWSNVVITNILRKEFYYSDLLFRHKGDEYYLSQGSVKSFQDNIPCVDGDVIFHALGLAASGKVDGNCKVRRTGGE